MEGRSIAVSSKTFLIIFIFKLVVNLVFLTYEQSYMLRSILSIYIYNHPTAAVLFHDIPIIFVLTTLLTKKKIKIINLFWVSNLNG